MLYLDYSRNPGEWIPNIYGGNENLEAIAFLRRMNELVYGLNQGACTCAEESTAWPMVSRPTSMGGLGFGYKWNMGWMNDTLKYISKDPIYRQYHHGMLTFGLLYAFNENFILPISHDEVVHGKGSMLCKMPGDEWQKFANLRAYYGFMYTHPGKKLLFMGCDFGQDWEWNYDESLRWHLLDYPMYKGMQNCVRDLNLMYKGNPPLYEIDFDYRGFEWLDHANAADSVGKLRLSGDIQQRRQKLLGQRRQKRRRPLCRAAGMERQALFDKAHAVGIVDRCHQTGQIVYKRAGRRNDEQF